MPFLTNSGLEYPAVNDPAYANTFGTLINAVLIDQDAELYTRTGNYSFADFSILTANTQDISETVKADGNKSGAVTLDYREGSVRTVTLTGNITGLTFTFPPAAGKCGFVTIAYTQGGAGSYTLTHDSAVFKAVGGVASIVLSTAVGARDKLYYTTIDGGTTWDVSSALNWS
jgi:hypothetical protein